jgi:hypothetical protein
MRSSKRPSMRPSATCIVVFSLGLLNVAFGLNARWQTQDFGDFAALHESAVNWWEGASLYPRANLNPPVAVVAMSPLGLIPVAPAWVAWQVSNAAAFGWTVRVALRATAQRATPWLLAVLAAHGSTAAQTSLGQIAWLLGLPLAYGWLDWRTARSKRAGAWLGIVLAVKPFLLPVLAFSAVSRTWSRLALTALLIGAVLTSVGVFAAGSIASRSYLDLSAVAWGSVAGFPLGSLTGMLHRWGVSAAGSLAVAGLLFVPVLWRWRSLDADRRWLAVLTTVLLSNPLGWVYYQAWLVPPLIALWGGSDRRLLTAGIAVGCLPPVVAAALPAVQPMYLVSLLLLWTASLRTVSPACLAAGPRASSDGTRHLSAR